MGNADKYFCLPLPKENKNQVLNPNPQWDHIGGGVFGR